MSEPLIVVENLSKDFALGRSLFLWDRTTVHAVNDFTMTVQRGEIVGIIGESGSGKTTLARVILGLTKMSGGSIRVAGVDIARASRAEMRDMRSRVAVVFQDPASNLNPRQTVLGSIMRPMLINGISKQQARLRAVDVIKMVKMDAHYLDSYPHQLSGGQQQRIAIARALALKPDIMILDEPTRGVDVNAKAEIHRIISGMAAEGLTIIMISSELPELIGMCDRIYVMKEGTIAGCFNRELFSQEEILRVALAPEAREMAAV